jgi:hypothetical protein
MVKKKQKIKTSNNQYPEKGKKKKQKIKTSTIDQCWNRQLKPQGYRAS